MQPVPASIARVLDRALAADPDREALVTRTRRLTYAELDARGRTGPPTPCATWASAPGDRVAASLPERRRRGGRLPRRHAPRRGVAGRQPGAGAAGEAVPARGLRRPRCCSATTSCPTSACGSSTWPTWRAAVDAADDGAGRRRRRPVRAGRASPTRAARPATRRARCTASTTCSCRAPCSSRPAATTHDAPQGRLLPVHHPQHGGAHHAARVAGRRVLDRDGPHRRRGRGRVDPRRAGHHVERPAGAAPQPGHDGLDRGRRPGVARRGVDRRRRLPRGDPLRLRGQVRPAGARHLRAERGADGRVDRRPRRARTSPAPAAARCRTSRCASPATTARRCPPGETGEICVAPGRRPLPADARLLGAARGHRPRRWPAASCTPATSASSTTTATSTSATARAS